MGNGTPRISNRTNVLIIYVNSVNKQGAGIEHTK